MTELTELLGCELTPVERSLIGFGESRGARLERERIIKLVQEHEAISDGSEGGDYAICVCQHWKPNAEPYVVHIERLIREGKQK